MKFKTKSEISVFFEIDGPYKAMMIPSSTEEGKVLKKRYVVYNLDGSIAELKGFEVKRRGELKIIKLIQSQIFSEFLKGKSLEECYQACAKVGEKWLDILFQKGKHCNDEEIIDYIGESRVMSKSLKEYEGRKGVPITSAKRLAEFLGEDIVKGKGLNCSFIISSKPKDAPLNERAIPISIFSVEESIRKKFLKKWLKESEGANFEMRNIIDWDYYIQRTSHALQKLVVIPSALQEVRVNQTK